MFSVIEATFAEMLSELDMVYEECIEAARTSIVRAKFVLQCIPDDIKVNNYMKYCLQFW